MRARLFMLSILLLIPFVGIRAQTDPLDSVIAFIRLVGTVRYFYPGDVAAATDWDAFTLHYIEQVGSVDTPSALADLLSAWFSPYAPEVQIYINSDRPTIAPIEQPPNAQGITLWVHIPLGAGRTAQLVEGRRIQAPLNATEVTYDDPTFLTYLETDPVVPVRPDPYLVDLGGGISAAIPIALYSDHDGTLPHIDMPPPLERSDSDIALHMAILAKAWNAIEHFFPYWREINWDWEGALRTALTEVQQGSEPFLYTLQRMMAHIHDGHSVTTGGGMGDGGDYSLPFTWDVIEGQLVVTTLLTEDSPLQPGTVITAINGIQTDEALASIMERISPDGQLGTYLALQSFSTGSPDKTVTLSTTFGDFTIPFSVRVNSSIRTECCENRPAPITDLGDSIWYIDMIRATQGELRRSQNILADARGLVIDARGYPLDYAVPLTLLGHMTDVPLRTPPFWIPLVSMPHHYEWQWIDVTYEVIQPLTPRYTSNVVWILNGNLTYSSAETIMGIVEGYHMGEIVGESSGGTSGNRVSFPLLGGYGTSWTGLYVTKFDGSPLYGVGITPTIPVNRTIAGVAAGRDELFDAAVAVTRRD